MLRPNGEKSGYVNVDLEDWIFSPQDGGSMFLQNISIYSEVHMMLQIRRSISTPSLPRESQKSGYSGWGLFCLSSLTSKETTCFHISWLIIKKLSCNLTFSASRDRKYYCLILPPDVFPMAGALLGCLSSWLPLRYLGRRATLQLVVAPLLSAGCCLTFVFCHITRVASPVLLLGVSLQGAALGVGFSAIPVYLLEIMCKTCNVTSAFNL